MLKTNLNPHYKNISIVPKNWQALTDEELNKVEFYVSYIYISNLGEEYLMSVRPFANLDISYKKKEIFNIIQILPFKLNSGFNPLIDDYYEYKGLFLNYTLHITPATKLMNNGSITIQVNYVNPAEYVFSLNNNYSSNSTFNNIENGIHELKIIHVITNQILIIPVTLTPVSEGSFSCYHNVLDAFANALPFVVASSDYKLMMECTIKRISESIINLNLHHKRIKDFRKNDIKTAIDNLNVPPHMYNKIRGHISLIYNILIDFDVVEQNLVRNVFKRKIVTRLRKIIPDDILCKIFSHLKCEYYTFYRYAKIFYYSGSRSTELFNIKANQVNLDKSEFVVVIKKGKVHKEVLKAISPDVLHLWKEAVEECPDKSYYLFSKGYMPGKKTINARINSAIWQYYVQKKLDLPYNFYSLKHKYLDILDEYKGFIDNQNDNIASLHAGHTSSIITDKHYLVGKKNRQLEALKHFSLEKIQANELNSI
jgi:integrase